MNVFETCFSKRGGRRIYLPEEEEEEEERNCFTCCVWTSKKYREGIRLPEGGRRGTIDDYLDPRSPVSIEVLLAEQEEELDHYLGQTTDDEDAFIAKRKNSVASNAFLEEDAQFLSEHRISAILVDRPKLGSANIFHSEQLIEPPQELLDVVIPVTSTSTSSISSRVFAIKTRPQELISDVMHITHSPQEIQQPIIPSPYVPPSPNVPPEPVVPQASASTTTTSTRMAEFPATTLTRSPYKPTPIMQHHDPIPTPPQPILNTGRRPSAVASLLGDKLDDFTEKLAFIKKNIIMSLDSDEEEELTENNHFYNTDPLNKHRKSLDGRDLSSHINNNGGGQAKWDNFVLPKFNKKQQAESHAVPRSVTQSYSDASSSDDEEPFDFSVVGKNVRNFGEGVMGNGLRMFNNISTRIKNQK
ncbi:uncharacterized protein EV154DRAFT_490509 [Mucor mucedo]|uniref:uncharacterized protein n=1 Tax=Mucor mucedo TaxID=29922 RepID=UPI002220A19C|nr:uncharacterized protein EV154DRAFT_490509 [Mucor mucedo]KAI7897116.1 hypothetical protein EV154DRAFT_490509 [Mucor mucedo]